MHTGVAVGNRLTTHEVPYDRRGTRMQVLAAETSSGTAAGTGRGAGAPVLHAREPVSLALEAFVAGRRAAGRAAGRPEDSDGEPSTPLAFLGALVADGEPWPLDVALPLLSRVAALLDAADAAGTVLGTFTPWCVAFYGPYLVLAPHDTRAGVDPVYVAPEQTRSGASVDARASQYGLARVACTLLAGTESATLAPPVRHVLRVARDPDPGRRFPTAGAFVAALDAACCDWTADGAALARPRSRRRTAGALVCAALLVGAGVGWQTLRPSAPVPPELRNDIARREATAAPARTSSSADGEVHVGGVHVGGVHVGGVHWVDDSTAARILALTATPKSTSAGPAAARPARDSSHAVPGQADIGRLGALAAAVVLPRAETVATRRRVSTPKEFASAGLAGQEFKLGPVTTPALAQFGADGPRYPSAAVPGRVAGTVVADFVVDSTGRVDPTTFTLVRSDHDAFTAAVRESLGRLRYVPAERAGRRVPQAVEQTFHFAASH